MPNSYTSYFAAHPGHAARGERTPGLALIGGPPEGPPPEVDAAFTWLIRKSGCGRFVVIGADGRDEYNSYIYHQLPPPHPLSVETLIFKSRHAASNRWVVERIRRADALFVQGGDQSDYLRLWKGTPVQVAINQLVRQGVPIGGSSAGLAVLGEFIFSARDGTVHSEQALANPYHERMVLDRVLLDLPNIDLSPYKYLRNVIADSHFHDRDRMGRLVTFLARIVQDGWAPQAKGIAVDELTALLVEADGSATVVDNRGPTDRGSVCFLRTPGKPELCQPNQPLTYQDVAGYRIRASDAGESFNLSTWTGAGGTTYTVSVKAGTVSIEGMPNG
jgi:cyanophycinase